MQTELLPAINKIVTDAELRLSHLFGHPVRLRMELQHHQVNEVFLQMLVCEEFGVSWKQIVEPCRKQEVVKARQAYWWLAMKWLKRSQSELAREAGGKDHTTVAYGRQKIDCVMESGKGDLFNKIQKIEEKIQTARSYGN